MNKTKAIVFLPGAATALLAAAFSHAPAPMAVLFAKADLEEGHVATLTTDCDGCTTEAGAGVCNPANPNDPEKNGDSDAPNEANADGELLVGDITTPPVASDSWDLVKSGNGQEFESTPGSCKENPEAEEGDPPCVQENSCTWKLKDTNGAGDSTLTITVRAKQPAGAGTTAPQVSSNLVQDQNANPPEYSASFSSVDPPMTPGCGGEIEYVATWRLAGAEQRWELSFRCTPCEPGQQ